MSAPGRRISFLFLNSFALSSSLCVTSEGVSSMSRLTNGVRLRPRACVIFTRNIYKCFSSGNTKFDGVGRRFVETCSKLYRISWGGFKPVHVCTFVEETYFGCMSE